MKIARTSTPPRVTRRVPGAAQDSPVAGLPADALDDRIAIVGTAGSGKTYGLKALSNDYSIAARGSRSWIRSACGGDCARAPTAARPVIP
jgi:hypothetical protein